MGLGYRRRKNLGGGVILNHSGPGASVSKSSAQATINRTNGNAICLLSGLSIPQGDRRR